MNKYVFLFELRRELSYMTPDDKEAAARFYEEYFSEAGPENEQKIIEELGPPSRLAAELRHEYEEGRPELTGRELSVGGSEENADADKASSKFGDSGVRSPLGNDPFAEDEKSAARDKDGEERTSGPERDSQSGAGDENRRPYGSRPSHMPPFGSFRYGGAPYGTRANGTSYGTRADGSSYGTRRNGTSYGTRADGTPYGTRRAKREPSSNAPNREEYSGGEKRKKLSTGAIVLIVICSVIFGPVAFGLIVTLFSVVFAICVALLSVGVAIIAAGIYAIIAGVWALGFIPDALLLFGTGLLAISVGLPLLWQFIWCSVKLVGLLTRGIRKLWRKIRGIGGAGNE